MFVPIYILFIIIVPSAAYTEVPGIQYILTIFLITSMFFTKAARQAASTIVRSKRTGAIVVGALTVWFVIVWAQLYHHGGNPRYLIIPLMVFLLYALTFVATYTLLKSYNLGLFVASVGAFFAIVAILCGQLLVLQGYSTAAFTEDELSKTGDFLRNGGFTNANQAGNVTLAMLYGLAMVSSKSKNTLLLTPAIFVTLAILIIAQSRSNLLFFSLMSIFLFITLLRGNLFPVLINAVIATPIFLFLNLPTLLVERLGIEKFIGRVEGTDEEDPRILLLTKAIRAFVDNPIFGVGPSRSHATHNQLVEWLVSYGIVGTVVILVGCVLMYRGQSIITYLFAIAPAFIFSHNFTNQTAFQVSIGFCFGVGYYLKETSQTRKKRRKRNRVSSTAELSS